MNLDYEILLNVLVYGALAGGILAWRAQQSLPKPRSLEEAFEMLEHALRHVFPDMKDGFTWREELSRARSLRPDLGWSSIEQDLNAYETYKYGTQPPPKMFGVEFLKLVKALRRMGPRH